MKKDRTPDKAREAALSTLTAVRERDAYANLVLPAALRRARLSGRDAGFATELTYGTLRGQGTYDAILTACMSRPLAEVDAGLLDVLRLGTHQVLAMRVPVHAAVSETVDQARLVGGPAGSRFVNAVMRAVAAHDLTEWIAKVAPDQASDPIGHLAVAASHPAWIVRALRDALALSRRDVNELPALLEADNLAPVPAVAALPGLAEVEELLEAGASPGQWSPVAVRTTGALSDVPAVTQGRARVQDEGSQLVALALTQVEVKDDAGLWLDLCAGPGGKAALLAAVHRERSGPAGWGQDARLDAVEITPHRADLVAGSLAPIAAAGGAVHSHCADGAEWGGEHPGQYDRVLVDAPCTGLGSLRRRPESRWRRKPEDLTALAGIQRALLVSAIEATRPGGVIAYVTCSPHPGETEAVIYDATRKQPVTPIDATQIVAQVAGSKVAGAEVSWGPGPAVQLWPHVHGTDAMYLALLRKKG